MTYALDFGTTNSALARWDSVRRRPVLIELPSITIGSTRERGDDEQSHLEAPLVVPTAVEAYERLSLWSRFGRIPSVQRMALLGKQGFIGREAERRHEERPRPGFAALFKPDLAHAPLRTVARVGGQALSAREAARLFLRELLVAAKERTSERIRELVVTCPVDAYESYRAEVSNALHGLGVNKVRFIDEPVAAALGYGLGLGKTRRVLVVDFGGGTLDVALVELTAKDMEIGQCRVLGKAGRAIGGRDVDLMLAREVAQRMELRIDDDALRGASDDWTRRLLLEARRLKERLFFEEESTIIVAPRDALQLFDERMKGHSGALSYRRAELVELLEREGVYDSLDACVSLALEGAEEEVDEVLLVGGSTLLPRVYQRFEQRFGRDAVRAWQPFEAVVNGATIFAAGKAQPSDFIIHDYAFVTHDLESHEKKYAVVVPRGTRFPTTSDFWKESVVPTCSLGEPETIFKLVVCELGRADGEQRFSWDETGNLRVIGGDGAGADDIVVVPLNESNPTLGYLRPPHPPDEKHARLQIAFGVNADRWLCATVLDLKTRRYMLRDEPVVRLL